MSRAADPTVSVVVPVYDEAESIDPLIDELRPVLVARDEPFELVFVDDGSTDSTPTVLRRRRETTPELRVITLVPNSGQSAAFEAGFCAARGTVIVTLDGDGQNDPADIPRVLDALAGHDAVFGVRVNRRDPGIRTFAQRIANGVRNFVLGESYRDVGCSLKAFRREVIAGVTLYDGLHRFFPYLVSMRGGRGIELEVSHRPRTRGQSKYRPLGRGWPAFWDLWMVRRMKRRALQYRATEEPQEGSDEWTTGSRPSRTPG